MFSKKYVKIIGYATAFLSILLFIFLESCQSNYIFDRFENIPSEKWDKNQPLHFNVTIEDTVSSVDVIVIIRHTGNYPYQNLYLFIETASPLGFSKRDTVLCMLADDKGEWKGKGFRSIYNYEMLYKKNVRFPFRGNYSFTFEQAMRDNPLPGILDIGLKIQKLKTN